VEIIDEDLGSDEGLDLYGEESSSKNDLSRDSSYKPSSPANVPLTIEVEKMIQYEQISLPSDKNQDAPLYVNVVEYDDDEEMKFQNDIESYQIARNSGENNRLEWEQNGVNYILSQIENFG